MSLCGDRPKPRPDPMVSERVRAKSCWDSQESTALTSLRALVDLHLDNFSRNNLSVEKGIELWPERPDIRYLISKYQSPH